MSDFQRELDVARDLARRAGAIILGYRGNVAVEHKAGDEPVTRADREASELIVAGLSAAFPGDVVISEEAEDDPARKDPTRRVWFVDPLDGTKDFVRGLPGFAVMIGLSVGARPVAGAVFQPVGERLFWAARGRGSFMLAEGAERRLATSRESEPANLRMVSSASHRSSGHDAVKNALGLSDEIQIGSVGLKLALISLAERDLYVNPSPKSKMWDSCAPEIILAEAGGRITDLAGRELRYDDDDLWHRRGLVASNGPSHDAVVARLKPLFAGGAGLT